MQLGRKSRCRTILMTAAVIMAALAVGPRRTVSGFRDAGPPGLPIGTTLEDFFMPGTQPDPTGADLTPIVSVFDCLLCHADFDDADPPLPLDAEPYRTWSGSMMAQATRDPVFWAAVTVANQDADFGGDLCLRCHTPAGWLAGRSTPTDGLDLVHFTADFEGVTCNFCHRMVNPMYIRGESPVEDWQILDDLDIEGLVPKQPGSGRYVVDPQDRRRGPYDLGGSFPFHLWLQSPFHQESALCATCHDVSNPVYTRQGDGSYALNNLDAPHPTMDKYDMFPIERTFGEWTESQFANGGVVFPDGRFGGALPDDIPIESCQDCHMPDQVSPGCRVPGFDDHPDMAAHFLNGGNTWVLKAVNTLYTDGDGGLNDPVFLDEPTGLTQTIIDESIARAVQMLRDASDLELSQEGNLLNVRVINFSGHKLPTGYHEGRRMWINVMFLDEIGQVVLEHGAYDFGTAELSGEDTKVYQAEFGLDAAAAAKTGLPQGQSFHFILNNVILLDNRIPPIGFTNAGFEAVQAEPVDYTYADGQHWDDTEYRIPPGSTQALVTVYYQLTSKVYIEFLRDENTTDNRGQIAYNQWVLHGKSAPVDMDSALIDLVPSILGDLDGDGDVDIFDLLILISNWGRCAEPCPPACFADLDADCTVGILDLLTLLANWG
ncbi:MAG: multiheme c-type cytochrome [Planctomycetota bacterium]|nr:multiheme c-type cytochrome [Planctomycetota bacterium]